MTERLGGQSGRGLFQQLKVGENKELLVEMILHAGHPETELKLRLS